MAMDGRLVTSEGHPVLSAQAAGLAGAQPVDGVQPGQGGPATQGGVAAGQNSAREAARFINLQDRARISP